MAVKVRRRPMGRHIEADRFLPYFMTAIANVITASGSQVYLRHFGVGMNDWRVLSYVGMDPGVTAQEISTHSGIDKSVVSRGVKSLVARGLVTVESSPGFRRLYLTGEGARLYKDIVPVAFERERILVDGLAPEEVQQLLALLRRVHANLPGLASYDPAGSLPEDAAAVDGVRSRSA